MPHGDKPAAPATLIREAADARLWADRIERRGDDPAYVEELRQGALSMEQRASAPLPAEVVEHGTGGEVVPPEDYQHRDPTFRDTVAFPSAVNAKASLQRVDLAFDAGCPELALDMAETIGAKNSVERALAHGIAACHRNAMMLAGRSAFHMLNATRDPLGKDAEEQARRTIAMNPGRVLLHNIEACRYANASAKMFAAMTQGIEALSKLRTGNVQKIVVQRQQLVRAEPGSSVHVAAGDNGTGTRGTTGGRGGRGRKSK